MRNDPKSKQTKQKLARRSSPKPDKSYSICLFEAQVCGDVDSFVCAVLNHESARNIASVLPVCKHILESPEVHSRHVVSVCKVCVLSVCVCVCVAKQSSLTTSSTNTRFSKRVLGYLVGNPGEDKPCLHRTRSKDFTCSS